MGIASSGCHLGSQTYKNVYRFEFSACSGIVLLFIAKVLSSAYWLSEWFLAARHPCKLRPLKFGGKKVCLGVTQLKGHFVVWQLSPAFCVAWICVNVLKAVFSQYLFCIWTGKYNQIIYVHSFLQICFLRSEENAFAWESAVRWYARHTLVQMTFRLEWMHGSAYIFWYELKHYFIESVYWVYALSFTIRCVVDSVVGAVQ